MAKYLLLKHYRRSSGPDNLAVPGADWSHPGVPMDQWTPEEIDAHIKYMSDFAAKLEETGEFVDEQALSAEGTLVLKQTRRVVGLYVCDGASVTSTLPTGTCMHSLAPVRPRTLKRSETVRSNVHVCVAPPKIT